MDEKAYFEAHEVLEEAWHPLRLADHPLSNLVKGLINGAIAFEHIKRNRDTMHLRAQKVIAAYERYKYLCTLQIEHAALFMQACEKIESLKIQHKAVFVKE